MSRKFNEFLCLSARQKRRRLSRIAVNRLNATQDSDSSNSTSIDEFENEPVQNSASHPALSASGDDLLNDNEEQNHQSIEREGTDDSEDSKDEEEGNGEDSEEVNNGYTDEENTSNSSEDNNENVLQHPNELKKRALKNAFLSANIKHNQGNIILKTLRAFPFNLTCLPKDTRTLLQTPTSVATRHVQQVAGGEYLHLGFKSTLVRKLESIPEDMLPNIVEIDFSTDGAEIYNSGTAQFWPIQYRIFNSIDKRPVIAGVFVGKEKPTNAFAFFEQFVEEIMDIRREGGILVRNRRLPLNLRCFIADAPARAFALQHYGHTSSNACSKCKIEGHRSKETPVCRGTMVFVGIRHPPRTDKEFHDMLDEDHHKGPSPLDPLLGLVTQVPFEPMHLVYIGNVKKVLHTQIHGKYGHRKLNKRKLDILDSRMTRLQLHCPSEFNRRPNKLSMFCHFKATEFILYTAPAVLESIFDEDFYEHFILLHCVMRLLSVENIDDDTYVYCQEAIETYVRMCETLYGEHFLSYNVHGLLHIVEDVKQLGSLESFSAFSYENNMRAFRKYIRKPHRVLQQFYKRICELNDLVLMPLDNSIQIRASKSHAEGPLVQHIPAQLCKQFHKLQIGQITFSTVERDNCCLLKNLEICIIKNIIQIEQSTFLIVQKFQTKVAVYNVGVTSDYAGVYHCSNLSIANEVINLMDIKSKMYKMPKWSAQEGQEERVLENEWICVSLITPLVLPQQ